MKIEKSRNIEIQKKYANNLSVGQTIKHNKFGSGKVLKIDGEGPNQKATVLFHEIGEKQLLLKYAKNTKFHNFY